MPLPKIYNLKHGSHFIRLDVAKIRLILLFIAVTEIERSSVS